MASPIILNNQNPSQPNRTPAQQILGPVTNIANNFVQGFYTFVFQNSVGLLNSLTLVVNPEEFEQIESSTTNVVLTAGDVFSDSFGPGLVNIRMSGTFGQRPIINGAQGSGQLELFKLRNLFRQYLDELNPITTPSPSKNIGAKLMFFNYKDNEFWQIEPVGNYLTLKRSKSSPFLYRYDLNFVATNRIGNNYLESLLYFFDNNTQVTSFLQETDSIIQTATEDISNITSVISLTFSGTAANAFANTVFAPLNQLSSAVETFLTAGSQIINFPQKLLNSMKTSSSNFQSQIFQNLFTLNAPTNTYIPTKLYDPIFSNILKNTILNCDSYQLYSNNFTTQYITSDFINQTTPSPDPTINYIDLSQVTNVTYYTIQFGDTLESIALNTLGSSDLWKVLATFNGLAYPYISTLGIPIQKTLSPGQQISIPSIQTNPSLQNAQSSGNIVLGQFTTPPSIDSSFGTDIFLDSTGDIDVNQTGDITTISGINNLKQALLLKLNVYRGELLPHPDFGILNILGLRTTPALTGMCQSQLEATLLSDPRVLNVPQASVSINGDVATFMAGVTPNFGAPPIILAGSFQGIS